jgi:hypothetical protein
VVDAILAGPIVSEQISHRAKHPIVMKCLNAGHFQRRTCVVSGWGDEWKEILEMNNVRLELFYNVSQLMIGAKGPRCLKKQSALSEKPISLYFVVMAGV